METQAQATQASKDELKAREAAEKAQKKAAEKAERAEKAAQAKTLKLQEKEAAKQAKADEKAAKLKAKLDAAEEKKSAKLLEKMPEQNGVRRPKPETLCGKAWAIFDELSNEKGSPAAIGDAVPVAEKQGLNVANVRCEYARWRKFYGIAGRVVSAKAAPAAQAAQTA